MILNLDVTINLQMVIIKVNFKSAIVQCLCYEGLRPAYKFKSCFILMRSSDVSIQINNAPLLCIIGGAVKLLPPPNDKISKTWRYVTNSYSKF